MSRLSGTPVHLDTPHMTSSLQECVGTHAHMRSGTGLRYLQSPNVMWQPHTMHPGTHASSRAQNTLTTNGTRSTSAGPHHRTLHWSCSDIEAASQATCSFNSSYTNTHMQQQQQQQIIMMLLQADLQLDSAMFEDACCWCCPVEQHLHNSPTKQQPPTSHKSKHVCTCQQHIKSKHGAVNAALMT